MGKQTNTGRTHFKKGQTPWNKGKKIEYTEARKEYDERQKGVTKKKPKNFSEIMRKVNPPRKRKKHSGGYVQIYKPEHFGSNKGKNDFGFIAEHRYIIEKFIKRKLKSTESVHHLNGNKTDNRLENLLLCQSKREHGRIHRKMNLFVFELIKKGMVYYDGEKFNIR